MFRPYRVRSLQGQFPQHMWLSATHWPSCSPGRLAHPGLINFLKHSSGPGPPLPRNFQWLFIAWRIKSLLLNLGIESLLESDPKAYLSLDPADTVCPCKVGYSLSLGQLLLPSAVSAGKVSLPPQHIPQGSACILRLPRIWFQLPGPGRPFCLCLCSTSSRLLTKAAQSRDSCPTGLLQHEFMRGAA